MLLEDSGKTTHLWRPESLVATSDCLVAAHEQ